MKKRQYMHPEVEVIVIDAELQLLEGSPDPLNLYGEDDVNPINDKTRVW